MVRTEQVWYSANSWKKPIWYSLTRSVMFDDILRDLEKVTIHVDDPWEPYVFEPGIFGYSPQFEAALRRLEK